MNKQLRSIAIGFTLLALALFGRDLSAQESKAGHSHAKAEAHGGTVVMSKLHHFEVVFKKNAVKVYLYDLNQNPIPAKGVKGTVTLKFRGGDSKTLPLEYGAPNGMKHKEKGEHMHKESGKEHHDGMGMDYLYAKVDLSEARPGQVKAVFSLTGLPNKKETRATFTETFRGWKKKGGHSHKGQKGDHHEKDHKH